MGILFWEIKRSELVIFRNFSVISAEKTMFLQISAGCRILRRKKGKDD